MRAQQQRSIDPFRCFVGRRVRVGDSSHVVEGYEVHGRDLRFRLRQTASGRELRVTVVELLELLDGPGP